MATVELELKASTKEAEKAIKSFVGSASGMLTGLKAIGVAAVAFLGGRAIVNSISEMVDSAAAGQEAINNLNISLASTGEYSAEASKEFQDYASEIQKVTKYDGDLILKNIALAKSFGLSNDQAKKAVDAAMELSAVTGDSLDTSVEQVSKTFLGTAGTLGKYNLAVRNMTAEQLRAGGAAESLIAQFGGSAEGQVRTFAGAVTQAENAFGDLQKEIGKIIVDNPAVVAAIQSIAEIFNRMTTTVGENKDGISDFLTDAIRGLVRGLPDAISFIGKLVKGYHILKWATLDVSQAVLDLLSSFYKLEAVKTVVNGIINYFQKLHNFIGGDDLQRQLLEDQDVVADFTDELDRISLKLESAKVSSLIDYEKTEQDIASLTVLSKEFGDVFEENLKKNQTAADDLATSLNKARGGLKDIPVELDKINLKGLGQNLEKVYSHLKDGIKKLFTDPEGAVGDLITATGDALDAGAKGFGKILAAEAGAGIAAAMKDGKAAAGDMMAKLFGAALDYVVPGLGQFLTPIMQMAQQDPEVIREQMKLFAEGLAAAAPAIVEGLVAAADELVFALVDSLITRGGLLKIVIAMVELVPRVGYALFTSFFEALKLAGPAMTEAFRKFFQDAIDFISMERLATFFENLKIETPQWVQGLLDAAQFQTPQWVRDFQDAVDRLFSFNILGITSGGSASGVVSSVQKAISFGRADGGMVPKGFPNDSYPAGLTSDELVVPARSSANLFDAIDNIAESESNIETTNNILLQILAAVGAPITVQTSAEVNSKAFADIMLNLSRRSARTAA